MTSDRESRWTEIKTIFSAVLSLETAERESYLRDRCGNDEELRREIESLLFAHDETAEFLERPVVSLSSYPDLESE